MLQDAGDGSDDDKGMSPGDGWQEVVAKKVGGWVGAVRGWPWRWGGWRKKEGGWVAALTYYLKKSGSQSGDRQH